MSRYEGQKLVLYLLVSFFVLVYLNSLYGCTALLCPDEDYITVVKTSVIFDECLLKFRLELKNLSIS